MLGLIGVCVETTVYISMKTSSSLNSFSPSSSTNISWLSSTPSCPSKSSPSSTSPKPQTLFKQPITKTVSSKTSSIQNW
ncbi:unnamed protein product [Adineta ricciae]|uniref:Uncharacterized protein n=1 Tax=Adineta ricciae TaxID=249248 RepID=A0A815ZB06_ADIRI|nr:unnamed protein product [Adineta ricciae]